MTDLFRRYATPLTTGLFLVSLISGVALFFHFEGAVFHGMHEWLSMLLIIPFVLHLWRNWRPMIVYFRGAALWISLGLSAVGAAAFAYPALMSEGGGGGRPPQFALAQMMLDDSIAELSPVLEVTAEELTGKLEAAGFQVGAPDASLREIAASSGKSDRDMAAALLAAVR